MYATLKRRREFISRNKIINRERDYETGYSKETLRRGTARTFARLLGEEEAEELLQQTLDEEGETDKKLTDLAEEIVNEQALVGDEAEETVTAKAGRR